MATLQEYADDVVAERYRQPLKTVEEACAAIGWPFVDRPECCGREVKVTAFLGGAYFAECETCGRFIRDMTAPVFGNSAAYVLSDEKVSDLSTDRRWIAGIRQQDAE